MATTRYPGVTSINGGYLVRAYRTDPKTGRVKEVRRVLMAVTLQEAVQQRTALYDGIAHGDRNAAPQTTLTEYARLWLKGWNGKVSTLTGKIGALERYILPHLGEYRIDQIRQGDIRHWMTQLSQQTSRRGMPIAPNTVNNAWRILRTILKDAVEDCDLQRDPTYRVCSLPAPNPYQDPNTPNLLYVHEVRPFQMTVRSLYPQHHPFVFLGFTTGMRFGELSALSWDDIKTEEGIIRVSKAQYRGVVSSTKTDIIKSIPLMPEMRDSLQEQRQRLLRNQNPGLAKGMVFPSVRGGYHPASFLDKVFKRALAECGIDRRLTFHGLRRTYNSLLRQAGTQNVVIKATTGHSLDEMVEHYDSVSMEERRKAAARLMQMVCG